VRSLLVFARNALRPFSVDFLSICSALMSADIAKASEPVLRLRMFSDGRDVL